ncbi:MAG: prenyltransferase [Acidimicrobiia bacterium]
MSSRPSTTLVSFVILSRPHFLAGAALLYAVGASAAYAAGATISWDVYWMGQAMVTSIQLVTHYSNEFFDVPSDRVSENRTWLSGGSGVLTDGRLTVDVALRAASVSAVVAAALVVWVYLSEPIAGLIGTVALGAGWFYSAPPLRLEASGLGELVATLTVAVLVPVTASLLQFQTVPTPLWWAVAGLAFLQFGMMLSFSIPDWLSDKQAGKLVLAARIGPGASRRLLSVALVAGFVVLTAGVAVGSLPKLLLPLLVPAALAAVGQALAAVRGRSVVMVTAAAATLLLAAVATLVAFIVLGRNLAV